MTTHTQAREKVNTPDENYNMYLWKQSAVRENYERKRQFMLDTEAMKQALREVGE